MTDAQILFTALCLSPFVFALICEFWHALKKQRRDGTDRFNPRPGTQPFKPESKIKPFRKSSDMLTKVDDE